MARKPSSQPHPKAAEVIHLSGQGYSQRQVARRVGVSQATVNRILAAPEPVVSADIADFRREMLQALDAVRAANGNSFLKNGAVDPMLYRLEEAEARFNTEYGLNARDAVQAAKLRRMMAEASLDTEGNY